MNSFDLKIHPHRRFNPLTREWVLVSPHRTQRPWQGQVEAAASERLEAYDPQCYLCPGNERAGGTHNPKYEGTFVFDNDFAALKPDGPPGEIREGDLLLAESERGRCRVVCFSPRHDLTLARMAVADIARVVETWTSEFTSLSSQPNIQSVQIFENRGAIMGCSNPHPHGQIWANETIPDELAKELASFEEYSQKHNAGLLEDYLKLELEKQERIVAANEHFVAVVPFWAVWPFETMVVSRRRVACLTELTAEGKIITGRDLKPGHYSLRQSLQDLVPIHHGHSPGEARTGTQNWLSSACALLSSTATIGNRKKIHGGL